MRRRTKRKLKKAAIILGCLLFIVCLVDFMSDSPLIVKFLSKNRRVANADLLLVEGWMQPEAFKSAAYEFDILGYKLLVTTGLNTPEYFLMSMDGYLIFDTSSRFENNETPGIHKIDVLAYSDIGGDNSAHFNSWVNDSILGGYSTIQEPLTYSFTWNLPLKEIDSLIVQFDNDGMGPWGDRNLNVQGLIVDDTIKIPYNYNSTYDIGDFGGYDKTINDYASLAEQARSILINRYGLYPKMLVAVSGEKEIINRTLTSALAFQDWLEHSDFKPKGINVISFGIHSRRTYMTYRDIIDKNIPVGIIALEDEEWSSSFTYKLFRVCREIVALIYYRIILFFH